MPDSPPWRATPVPSTLGHPAGFILLPRVSMSAVDGATRVIVDRIEAEGYVVEMDLQCDGVCIGAIECDRPDVAPLRIVKINEHGRRAEYQAACQLASMIGLDLTSG